MQTTSMRLGLVLGSSARRWFSVTAGKLNPRVFITGGLGQLGTELAKNLRAKYGSDNIILSDIKDPTDDIARKGPFIKCDVRDANHMNDVIKSEKIDWMVHFSALLSAIGEKDVEGAIEVNVLGLHNVFNLARKYNLRIFCPSTIGAFGPTTPRINTPDLTIQRPTTIYGVTKVYMELLGEYYHKRPETLDFRSARFPGILSANTDPGGGTTDYAVHIFHEAIKKGRYTCYLRPNTRMPMMYIDDCIRGTVELLEAPSDILHQRVYNMAAISFTPEELAAELKKFVPGLEIDYEPDERQKIADSWPESFDDSNARKDWGWNHEYDLTKMTQTMYKILEKNLKGK